MDRHKLRKEFAKRNGLDNQKEDERRKIELMKKLSEHKYGGHGREQGGDNAR